PAAYAVLPAPMASPGATAMLLAIGWQESRFAHRQQVGGPARGYWQFEQMGGVRGVLAHAQTGAVAREALVRLGYRRDATPWSVYDAIAHNDMLAAGWARLLLWTLPDALPQASDVEVAWRQYMAAWRPGRPHRGTWDEAWQVGNRT